MSALWVRDHCDPHCVYEQSEPQKWCQWSQSCEVWSSGLCPSSLIATLVLLAIITMNFLEHSLTLHFPPSVWAQEPSTLHFTMMHKKQMLPPKPRLPDNVLSTDVCCYKTAFKFKYHLKACGSGKLFDNYIIHVLEAPCRTYLSLLTHWDVRTN